MDIMRKIAAKAKDNMNTESITIAFLGDSVTQGCFEVYKTSDTTIETVYDKESAYHTYLNRILSILYPSVPVNIINAGISGDVAPHGLERLERDVLRHSPDLTVVCFGLNDTYTDLRTLPDYKEALDAIFKRLKAQSSEVIFMTPNMMNVNISCHIQDEFIRGVAVESQECENSGALETYLKEAIKVCEKNNVPVCDCYRKWKTLYEHGVEVTELLANKINHPIREMNWLFAISLIETMFQ